MLPPHAFAPAAALLALATAPAFATAPALAQRDAGIREGDHFRIIPHLGAGPAGLTGELVLAALETAEATWVHAAGVYGFDPEDAVPGPLRIHLYRDRAAFDDACFRCEGRTWPNNSGLTSGNWGIALILLGRGLSDAALSAVGLTDADRELVAHEATHLLGSHMAPGYAAHPAWLTEGVAEWVALRVARGEGPSGTVRPTIDSRLAHLKELLSRDEFPRLWALLRDELDDLDTYRRYALYGAFVQFLLTGSDAARLERVLCSTPASAEPGEVRRLFLSGLGEDALEELEQRFLASLQQSTPRWALGAGVLQADGRDRWWQLAPEHEPAVAWRLPAVEEGDYSLTGNFSLSPGARQRLEVRLGRGLELGRLSAGTRSWKEHYLAVTFGPADVRVGAYWNRGEPGLTSRGGKELARTTVSLEPGTQHAFRIMARGGRLLVQLDGEPQLEVGLGEHSALGQWGVSAAPGSFGRWAHLRLVR